MDHLGLGILPFAFILISQLGQVHLEEDKRDIKSFLTRKKCMDELGCFSSLEPFFNLIERPLSLLPDDREKINTMFLLYTPENPNESFNFSNMNFKGDFLTHSGFNPNRTSRFIIPGYVSFVSPYWKKTLKDALLNFEPSNVFYVDWSDGDGPLYEQAASNTRVVGAEIALFIHRLQEQTGIKPESVHLIGHSLGSHIAGYVGKRIENLGRITGMDPAGPYFSNVDPVVRLDRNDSLFVDVIHTNYAPSRFIGFGLTESIGHFDFFPNGGNFQPGCKHMGHAALLFLTHPSFDPEDLLDIECNHIRAIEIFISSTTKNDCELIGVQCDTWDDFKEGECTCGGGDSVCVPVGMHANRYTKLINREKSLNFYLTTTDSEPFCSK